MVRCSASKRITSEPASATFQLVLALVGVLVGVGVLVLALVLALALVVMLGIRDWNDGHSDIGGSGCGGSWGGGAASSAGWPTRG